MNKLNHLVVFILNDQRYALYLSAVERVIHAVEITPLPKAPDIILCRNVFMYFVPEQIKKAVQNFNRSLVDGGWVIVSPCETSHVLYSQFLTVNFDGAILYKSSQQYQTIQDFLPEIAYSHSLLNEATVPQEGIAAALTSLVSRI